jgi:hypothetical protein
MTAPLAKLFFDFELRKMRFRYEHQPQRITKAFAFSVSIGYRKEISK